MTTDPSVIAAVIDALGSQARGDAPLGALTTYRVGGCAAVLVEARDHADLRRLRDALAGRPTDVLVVGRGSNLLVADGGFPGVAVVLGEGFGAIAIDDVVVRAGAAVSLPVLARRTAAAGLTGFEWAVGVPGSVGGAVRMNAGGHGSDMRAVVSSYTVVDLLGGPDGRFDATHLAYGYRSSAVAPHQVVTEAELVLAVGESEASEGLIAEIVRWRRANQPGGQNAGSVFTNPPGASAGQLIDAAGLKGRRRGSAHVSPKHANFIQADEGGSADDVLALIQEVQERVREVSGVELVPELRMVGFR